MDQTSPEWRTAIAKLLGQRSFPVPALPSTTADAFTEPLHSATYDAGQLRDAIARMLAARVQAREPNTNQFWIPPVAPAQPTTAAPPADPFDAIAKATAERERIARELGPVGQKILNSPITTGKWW